MWSDYFPSLGPDQKPVTVWFDPNLTISMFTDPRRSFAREVRVSGSENYQRFTMNTWGPPTPKWLHTKVVHKGNVFASDDQKDFYTLSILLGEPKITPSRTGKPKTSFVFRDPENFVRFQYIAKIATEDEVTQERFRPENARNTEVISTTEVKKGSGHIDVVLPRKDEEMEEAKTKKVFPGQLWDRKVELRPTGLSITAMHSWTIVDPPREGTVRSVKRIVERLKVEFDQDMSRETKPPKRGSPPRKK